MRAVDWIEKNLLDCYDDGLDDPSRLTVQLGVALYDDGSEEAVLYQYVDGQWTAEQIIDTHEH